MSVLGVVYLLLAIVVGVGLALTVFSILRKMLVREAAHVADRRETRLIALGESTRRESEE